MALPIFPQSTAAILNSPRNVPARLPLGWVSALFLRRQNTVSFHRGSSHSVRAPQPPPSHSSQQLPPPSSRNMRDPQHHRVHRTDTYKDPLCQSGGTQSPPSRGVNSHSVSQYNSSQSVDGRHSSEQTSRLQASGKHKPAGSSATPGNRPSGQQSPQKIGRTQESVLKESSYLFWKLCVNLKPFSFSLLVLPVV